MMDIIHEWTNNEENKSHSFTITWTKAKYFGLRRHSTWDKVSTILSLTTITDYINYIYIAVLKYKINTKLNITQTLTSFDTAIITYQYLIISTWTLNTSTPSINASLTCPTH